MKKTILILFAMTIAAGCGSMQKKPKAPPDPAAFEELTAGKYWEYKSNVAGKVINEWQSPDGIWQYGQYVVKRALDRNLTYELEREIDLEIMRYFKVRTSVLDEIGATLPCIEAKITSVSSREEGRITIDKGTAEGVREGRYATALLKMGEGKRSGLYEVMDRYYYEHIKDVVATFVVERAEEDTATLKFLQRRGERRWKDLQEGATVFVGPAPIWKREILHIIPYAVEELARLVTAYTRERAMEKIAEFLAVRYDGDKTTIDEMLTLLESGEPETRKVIITALRQITAREFGYAPEKDAEKNRDAIKRWKKWWAEERSSFEVISPKKGKKRDTRDDRLHDRGWGPAP
ncbi:MAG: hypothetical protein DRP79_00880 [Planctomycetota bacterium]|nr:MAG: hypothetical protein DRP79_00880 [Planctomycetota bacterium]